MLAKYIIRGNKRKNALDDEKWMNKWFAVHYKNATVEFNRDYYTKYDAQYLTDAGMKLLCKKIEKELPFYEDIDRIAEEYASGEPQDIPTLDDLVDMEARNILVSFFKCPEHDWF